MIAPPPDGCAPLDSRYRSTWYFNHNHQQSKTRSIIAAKEHCQHYRRRIDTATAAHSDARFSAPEPTVRMGCRSGASDATDGYRAARILGVFDRRWSWLKCQVDRWSGGEQ
eukprot:scaffold67238_cov23-Cyclotella_meneghiniana.AAC.2